MFPIQIVSKVESHEGPMDRQLVLNSGLTVILGPNGSGKTHLLRGLQTSLSEKLPEGKAVRFMSAGRIGPLETFRADYDGHRAGAIRYDNAHFGNKGDAPRRLKIETLNGDFQTLAERVDIFVMIRERLRKLLRRDIEISWDGGELRIHFSRADQESKPYPSAREASGLLHLVGILAALYNDEIGALLVDEPEVSLHPQLQAFLLGEMQRVSGIPSAGSNSKLIVIATHSTAMVPLSTSDDVASLVFSYDLRSPPVQIPRDHAELNNKKVKTLVGQLGHDHKLALFSKRPLVVEGPSDSIICRALSRRLDLHLEAAGSQLLPVIGKGNVPAVLKLLRLLGKEPVVLADADLVADGLDLINDICANNPRSDEVATASGHGTAQQFARTVYESFIDAVGNHWPVLAQHAEKHPYWINKKEGEEAAARRRAAFGTLFLPDADVDVVVQASEPWRRVKTRLTSLLGFLEQLGCFVLRRGSIECYYQVSDRTTSSGKPNAAVEELAHINKAAPERLHADYGDVVRSVTFAADARPIVEAEAVRDLVLAIGAPAVARLATPPTVADPELHAIARGILGERAKLFKLQVEGQSVTIALNSHVLKVPGFPLTLKAGDDVIKLVKEALKL
jgi:hypothetical protein